MPRRYWPLAQGTFTLSSGFGQRWGSLHAGQDFAAKDGTPFYACQGGTVLYIGAADGYGQWIVLDHSDADGAGVTEYGHMWDAFATGLKAGDRVEAGRLIGYVGSNGQSTGAHLHLSLMPREYNPGKKIDPLPWLKNALYPGKSASQKEKPVTSEFTADVDILSPNDSGRRDPRTCAWIIVHTNEGDPNGRIEDLLSWLAQPRAQASYTIVVGRDGRTGRSNSDNFTPWAAGSPANEKGLHLCLLGRASTPRKEWVAQSRQLDAAARVVKDWSDRYSIPLTKLSGESMRAGQKGLAGHDTTVAAWHVTDHTDPGAGFPWDVLIAKARGTSTSPPTQEDDMAFTDDDRRLLQDVREQLCGDDQRTGGYKGWSQLGGKTLVDALAELLGKGK